MKLKKYSYILVFILMLVIGINNTYADSEKTCYYISGDDNLKISLRIGYGYEKVAGLDTEKWSRTTVWKTSKGSSPKKSQAVENWFNNKKAHGITIEPIYREPKEANAETNPKCPKYLVYTACPVVLGFGNSDKTYATDSSTLASNLINAAGEKCSYAGYASNYKNGKQITEDMFFTEFVSDGLIEYDETKGAYTCADMDTLFGSKNDPESIRYMVNEVLNVIRIIAPILIILFGTIDFAKAVIAGKQDNMKKAQSDFVKRLIAGVAIFLIPTLVDIIMGLADIVWAGEYTHCDF